MCTLTVSVSGRFKHLLANHPRLKESEEARTLCVSIEGLECAGELVKALTAHAGAMVKLYRQLHQYTIQNVNDQSVYDPIFDQATSYTSWFKARKKVANSMKQAAEKSD